MTLNSVIAINTHYLCSSLVISANLTTVHKHCSTNVLSGILTILINIIIIIYDLYSANFEDRVGAAITIHRLQGTSINTNNTTSAINYCQYRQQQYFCDNTFHFCYIQQHSFFHGHPLIQGGA